MHGWDNFYIIIGSASAALTGLQFVVFTLVAQIPNLGSSGDVDAFGTPTIVHFAVALLISAIVCAPWPEMSQAAIALAVCGAGGIVYIAIVARRARRARYTPVVEDWIWHIVLPLAAYVALAAAPVVLVEDAAPRALFIVAAAAISLVFIGIHNAWDTVTYVATLHEQRRERKD